MFDFGFGLGRTTTVAGMFYPSQTFSRISSNESTSAQISRTFRSSSSKQITISIFGFGLTKGILDSG
jgi:hypothetical protein